MMIVLLLIFQSFFAGSYSASKLIMEARLENYYQCPDLPKTQIIFSNMIVKRINAKESRLFGDVHIDPEVKNEIKMTVELNKCASKSEPDTCEYYTSLKVNSLCEKIEKKLSPWYDYWNSTTIPQKWPLKAGDYKVNGAKIGLESSFPLFDGFWRFKNKALDRQGKPIICFIMELNIHRRFKL